MIFISKNLELLRKDASLKQAELADKLGVKPNTISNYEKGVSQPDYLIVSKLMELFNVTSDQLLFTDLTVDKKSRVLIKEEVTESVFEKFLSKINERDRKLDEKDTLLKEKDVENKQLQTELRSIEKELVTLKAQISTQKESQAPEHPPLAFNNGLEAFTEEPSGGSTKDYAHMRKPTITKKSSASKT